jgi:prepilin-type N-terminal cleavage/methylation domain-containing protein
MQRSPLRHAFTLIEMITVIAIIAILSGMIISLAGLMTTKQNRAKAQGDITALIAACEAYRTDNGGYPQDSGANTTNDLDPRADMNPTDTKYQTAIVFLYKQLSGDEDANGQINGTEVGRKYASEFWKPSRFDVGFKNGSGIVKYIQDPWGYSYGYSTAGLKDEQDYRVALETDKNADRPGSPKGFNPTFDIWSTGGSTGPKASATKDQERNKWIKNW